MRRLAVAGAILATLLTLPLGVIAADPVTPSVATTDSERATAALGFLLASQRADGSIDGSIGETADFVIGTAAAGYDPSTLTGCGGGSGALGYLAAASDGAAADAARTGKIVLAVVAAGGDPADFAGRNLTRRLGDLYHAGSGVYGDGATFSQSFAILATLAAGESVPPAATDALLALQDSDGSWSYGTAPVPAGQGDTNSTAIALMALNAAGVHSADATALTYLRAQQLADGGFPYQNSSTWGPPVSDPDSDSLVLQALIASGEDPEAAAWAQGSSTVLTHLRAAQAGSGGFAYPGMAADAFTTSQVPAALMRTPYGSVVHFASGRTLPATACPTAAPTAIPTVVATPTPSLTPTYTPRPSATPRKTPGRTPVRTPAPAPTDLPVPTDSIDPDPTATASPTPLPSATAPATPTMEIEGATFEAAAPVQGPPTSGKSGGTPTLLFYLIAALGGLALVVCGWVFFVRPASR
jgi:hypothetical protein